MWLRSGAALIFPSIRKKLGPNLNALICGSAPLARETQLFFMMLGIPVLQVYGLTETTAICTMDDPRHVEPGTVGPAIPGIEMKLGEDERNSGARPEYFPGYWNRPEETAKVLADGWFHTGDQGEQTACGKLAHHRAAEESADSQLRPQHRAGTDRRGTGPRHSRRAASRVWSGTGEVFSRRWSPARCSGSEADAKLARLNATLPHYRQIHACHIEPQPLTIESGLLTANGKLRRDAIAAHFREAIEDMYSRSAPLAQ